jgi:hypothetical protein
VEEFLLSLYLVRISETFSSFLIQRRQIEKESSSDLTRITRACFILKKCIRQPINNPHMRVFSLINEEGEKKIEQNKNKSVRNVPLNGKSAYLTLHLTRSLDEITKSNADLSNSLL